MNILKHFLVLLLLVLPAVSYAQAPKALFDNTHVETAGNADWIIDVQQPVPLPDQSTINATTPGTYWTGAISSWGIDLVRLGYTVHTLTTTYGITYGSLTSPYDLSKYKLFIVCEPQTPFTAAEKSAILAFVQNGGGLMMVADHTGSDRNGDGWDSPQVWNDLGTATAFGIHFQSVGETSSNLTGAYSNLNPSLSDSIIHGPSGDVTALSYHNGTTMTMLTANNPNAVGHIWLNGITRGTTQIVAATSRYGLGKVAAVGDSSPADDSTGQSSNTLFNGWRESGVTNNIVFLNMCSWLAAPSALTPPAQVTLVSPLNGATGVTSPSILQWNKPSGATGYQVDVSTSNTFASFFVTDSTLTDSVRSVGGMSLNTVYYWRVRAKNGAGWGTFSTTRSFTSLNVPAAAVLMIPADGAANQPSPSLHRWNGVPSATGYQIEVATSNTFTTPLVSDSALTDTTRSVGGLSLSTLYYWHVRAKNGAGWGSYSAARSFTTWDVPSAPTLVSPSDGATDIVSPASFRWNAASFATGYQIDLSTSNTFAPMLLTDSTLTDTTRNVGGFAANTLYYWRVRAKDGAGWGAFSSVRSFTSFDVPPAVPLVSPANGGTDVQSPSPFRWNTLATATGYQIDVSSSNTFAPMFMSDSTLTDTTRSLGGFAANTIYYWRVRARNGAGWGVFSSIRSFTTLDVPAAVTLASPADSATNIDSPVTLFWNGISGATAYDLDVSTSGAFATLLFSDTTVTDTSRAVGGLSAGTNYFWRVRAKNAAGWGSESTTRIFSTGAPPPVVTLVNPGQGALGVPVPTSFHWTSDTAAMGYEFDLSTFSDFSIYTRRDTTLSDTSLSVGGLLPDTVYYWNVRARNAAGWGSYAAMGFFRTWKAPSRVQLDVPADSSSGVAMPVDFRWHFGSGGIVYRLSVSTNGPSPVTVFVDSSITDTTWTLASLNPGTTYRWSVAGRNLVGWGPSSLTRTLSTWHVPAQIILVSPSDGATGLARPAALAWHSPDPAIAFQLQISTSASFTPRVVNDSTLTDSLFSFSPADSIPVYYWRVRAKGNAGWGAFSASRSFSLFHIQSLTGQFNSRWNIVSVPLKVVDPRASTLFPAAVSPAYAFENGYAQKESLANGVGYWMKFPAVVEDTVSGIERLEDSVAVHSGWNLVGSLSISVTAAAVTSVPAGIVSSPFYGFGGTYAIADTLLPFRGYWVKCSQDGVLVLK